MYFDVYCTHLTTKRSMKVLLNSANECQGIAFRRSVSDTYQPPDGLNRLYRVKSGCARRPAARDGNPLLSLRCSEHLTDGINICQPVLCVWLQVAPLCPFVPAVDV